MQREGRRRRGAPPPAPASVEILEIAFHRASLATPKGSTKAERDRLRARLKVVRSGATVVRQLQQWTRPFRAASFSPFDATLVSSRFGAGMLERSLSRVQRAQQRIRGLQQESERAVQRGHDFTEHGEEVRRFYGRLASHVREVDPDLARLREVQRFLRERPRLDARAPTLVVAGFPNVGKSALVERLSSAHPRIAEYPFTTLAIEVGHADLGFDRWQVLDTPGVLGRTRRANPAEKEAEVAVERAASVVLFVLDPSESSGYTIEEQERLLTRWQQELPGRPIVVVESKADLVPQRATDRLRISVVTGEGLEELRRAIRAVEPSRAELPPADDASGSDGLEPPSFDRPIEQGDGQDDRPRRRPRRSK